jgi:hypothetical protein
MANNGTMKGEERMRMRVRMRVRVRMGVWG